MKFSKRIECKVENLKTLRKNKNIIRQVNRLEQYSRIWVLETTSQNCKERKAWMYIKVILHTKNCTVTECNCKGENDKRLNDLIT